MDTRELIEALRAQPGNIAFSPQIRAEAADRLEQLVDDLHWYMNMYRELRVGLKRLLDDKE